MPSSVLPTVALDLSNKQPDFAAKGVKLVGVVHEKLGVEEFSGFFKNGEIYFDQEKAFFNGERPFSTVVWPKYYERYFDVTAGTPTEAGLETFFVELLSMSFVYHFLYALSIAFR